jgi:Arc/MetJ-type ribon-helix-helix transcriptional regulator
MAQKRAHVFIPEALLAEIDKLVGKGKRSSLITEILDHEVRRRRLMQILDGDQPIWKDEDHPELKDGAYAWVRSLRDESNKRLEQQAPHWDAPSE